MNFMQTPIKGVFTPRIDAPPVYHSYCMLSNLVNYGLLREFGRNTVAGNTVLLTGDDPNSQLVAIVSKEFVSTVEALIGFKLLLEFPDYCAGMLFRYNYPNSVILEKILETGELPIYVYSRTYGIDTYTALYTNQMAPRSVAKDYPIPFDKKTLTLKELEEAVLAMLDEILKFAVSIAPEGDYTPNNLYENVNLYDLEGNNILRQLYRVRGGAARDYDLYLPSQTRGYLLEYPEDPTTEVEATSAEFVTKFAILDQPIFQAVNYRWQF